MDDLEGRLYDEPRNTRYRKHPRAAGERKNPGVENPNSNQQKLKSNPTSTKSWVSQTKSTQSIKSNEKGNVPILRLRSERKNSINKYKFNCVRFNFFMYFVTLFTEIES